jgi:hypothetical protein
MFASWIGSVFYSVHVTLTWCLIHVMPQFSGYGRQFVCAADVHFDLVLCMYIYGIFRMCSDVFPCSPLLRLSLCQLYSHLRVEYLI